MSSAGKLATHRLDKLDQLARAMGVRPSELIE